MMRSFVRSIVRSFDRSFGRFLAAQRRGKGMGVWGKDPGPLVLHPRRGELTPATWGSGRGSAHYERFLLGRVVRVS
jgi:hypothetical protein